MASAPGDDPPEVFFEGELFEVESLCARLDLPATASAGDVLGAVLAREGPAGLAGIDGVFVVAQVGATSLRLYCDPSGLRGLYWASAADGRRAYAKQPMALSKILHSAPCVARPALHEYLRMLDIAPPQTFVDGVQAVEPGTLLTFCAGAEALQDDVVTSAHMPAAPHFGAALDVLDGMLQQSTLVRLARAPRAAAFLSGGVDSALLCAIAARQRPDTTALTVGFDSAPFDEAPIAARIAAHLGLRHEVLRFGRQDFLTAFDRLACGMDQPMADPATMATVLAFDHCKLHFDVVLDGTGADEAVGTMPPRHVRLAMSVGSLMPAAFRRRLVRGMRRVPALAGYTPILDFEHPAETLMRWNGFTRAEIEELCGEPVSLEHTRFYRTFARFPPRAHCERYSALLDAMPCDRLTQATKLSGMRVRYPFCARYVNAYLRQLPMEWRQLPAQPKRILRELLARYVPRQIWDVPKHGFNFPLHDFLAGDDFALVRRHVDEGHWLDGGLLRADVARRYARQYIAGDRRLMFRVWALVVLGAWLDKHEELN